jgi:tetratricopeptide (TPR) repeat protein
VSYILFLSLLAYMHSRTALPIKRISNFHLSLDKAVVFVALPVSIIALFVLYTVNFRPMMSSVYLIKGLEVSQTSGTDKNVALEYCKKAYESSRLGRPEVVEWTATSAGNLNLSNLSDEDKTKYLLYTKKITEDLASLFPTDTRYQILAGTYLTKIGYMDEGFSYLEKARELTPGKQIIYFETGAALVDKGDYKGALDVFKQAYDLEPDNKEARLIYMVGAIYAGEDKLFNDLSKTLSIEDIASDPRIANALLDTKNFKELIALLKINLGLNPKNPQAYASLSAAYMKSGDKEMAIEVLRELGNNIPSLKSQADKYIEQIKNGTIK